MHQSPPAGFLSDCHTDDLEAVAAFCSSFVIASPSTSSSAARSRCAFWYLAIPDTIILR